MNYNNRSQEQTQLTDTANETSNKGSDMTDTDVPAAVKFQLTHTVPVVTLQFIDQTTTVVSTSSDHTLPPTMFSKIYKLLSTNTFFQSTLLGLLASWRSTCMHACTGTLGHMDTHIHV